MEIEELFKQQLDGAKLKAPDDLWNKIESGLNTNPQIDVKPNATSTIGTTIKAIAVGCGVTIASVATYMIYDSQKTTEEPQTTITQIIEEIPIEAETITPTPTPQEEILIEKPQTSSTKQENTTPIIENIIEEPQIQVTPTQNVITEPIIAQTPIQEEVKAETIVEQKTEEQAISTPIEETIKPEQIFSPDIKIPNFVSPNHDGINDKFEILNIENYPDNELIIFDSRGRIIFQTKSYNNDWEAAHISQGSYFYKLLIRDGQNQKIYNGSLTIKF